MVASKGQYVNIFLHLYAFIELEMKNMGRKATEKHMARLNHGVIHPANQT
jgi:hypothetical protein